MINLLFRTFPFLFFKKNGMRSGAALSIGSNIHTVHRLCYCLDIFFCIAFRVMERLSILQVSMETVPVNWWMRSKRV